MIYPMASLFSTLCVSHPGKKRRIPWLFRKLEVSISLYMMFNVIYPNRLSRGQAPYFLILSTEKSTAISPYVRMPKYLRSSWLNSINTRKTLIRQSFGTLLTLKETLCIILMSSWGYSKIMSCYALSQFVTKTRDKESSKKLLHLRKTWNPEL